MVPRRTDQSEIVATLYAAWGNLLRDNPSPSDEQILYEARENWHAEKEQIPRERFVGALVWMRKVGLTPFGNAKRVM